mmetsp:Transcript_25225/g.59482  ORF Transcript_25225/g.59482 Transcript_25225/m.59482 type:complete len:122 (+) Transcript_25225:172-537(+)
MNAAEVSLYLHGEMVFDFLAASNYLHRTICKLKVRTQAKPCREAKKIREDLPLTLCLEPPHQAGSQESTDIRNVLLLRGFDVSPSKNLGCSKSALRIARRSLKRKEVGPYQRASPTNCSTE